MMQNLQFLAHKFRAGQLIHFDEKVLGLLSPHISIGEVLLLYRFNRQWAFQTHSELRPQP